MSSLRFQAKVLPTGPGVYRFDDANGQALYIGKAVNLRRRVLQHLDRPMREGLLDGAVRIEVFETGYEAAALSLERELIRRYRPPRNIRLPARPLMLCLTDDAYPRLALTRQPQLGWRAFGPYEEARVARRLLETLEKTFRLRSCTGREPGRPQTPCLEFYMGRCSAPCTDRVDAKAYGQQVAQALQVLEGQHQQLCTSLTEAMQQAAEARDYEQAALLRDRLKAVEQLGERSRPVGGGSYDLLALARSDDQACIELRRVRAGQLVDAGRARLQAEPNLGDAEILRQYLLDHAGELHGTVAIPVAVDADELQQWRRRALQLVVPRRGARHALLEAATESAAQALRRPDTEQKANPLDALEALAEQLSLDALPLTIECVDISNLGARQTVGAIVRLEAGERFEQRTVFLAPRDKPNDVASIGELLERRCQMTGWHERPDLMVIDGGKGQLARACKSLAEWRQAGLVVVALAKREELVFVPGRSAPLRPSGAALRLLQRLRDRTHDTAVGAHRRRRDRDALASPLEGVSGIGPARRRQLLDHFGGLDAVLQASQEELAAVLPHPVAERLYSALHG